MKKNLGMNDQTIRIVLAIIIAIHYFVTHTITGTLGIILLIIGGILLVTSITSFCPIYAIFGIRTCASEKPVDEDN